MELIGHDGGPSAAICKHCGAPGVGPCARCELPLCGDCAILSEGGVRVFAICRDCAAEGSGQLGGPWRGVITTFLLPIVGLVFVLFLLSLIFR